MFRFDTVTQNYSSIDGWTPELFSLEMSCRSEEVAGVAEMRPCGCGVKLDLNDVVYPALGATKEFSIQGVGCRRDAHQELGVHHKTKRYIVPFPELDGFVDSNIHDIIQFAQSGSLSVVELFSMDVTSNESEERVRNRVERLFQRKAEVLREVSDRLILSGAGGLRFGKGHSIRAGGNVFVFDFLKHQPALDWSSYSNNDTIVTADSVIKTSALASIFTALNNALNDIFVLGVCENIKIYPSYDSDNLEMLKIQRGLASYAQFFKERGVAIDVIDSGPLGVKTSMIGATVVGHSNKHPPTLSGLKAGYEILLTRPLGDLSFLARHRGIHFNGCVHDDVDKNRLTVLQRFVTPNYLIAKVINKFLPSSSECFDPGRHIGFATDISGPGLSVLNEAMIASSVDVCIDSLKFMFEESLAYPRKNHTSSTNGPLMVAAEPQVLTEFERALAEIGINEYWRLGRVLQNSLSATVYVREDLLERYSNKDPLLDVFAGGRLFNRILPY